MKSPYSYLNLSDKVQHSEYVSSEPIIVQADSWAAASAIVDKHEYLKTVKEIITQGRRFIPDLNCTDGAIRTD
jgi:hypothetical protein